MTGFIVIAIGGVMLLKEAWDYQHGRIKNKFVEVNRLEDAAAFCRHAAKYVYINAAIVLVLAGMIFLNEYRNMPFDFVLFMGLTAIFLVRSFRFPRTFEAFYRPITIDEPEEQPAEPIDEKQVDE